MAVDITIEQLQMKLSDLAVRYRVSAEDSEEHRQVLDEYYKTFWQLVELCGKIVGLDPDAELPDRLMPREYVDHWLKGQS